MVRTRESDQGISLDYSLFDGDPEFMVEIVNLFLATYSDLLSDIDAAVLRQDSEGLRRAAHTMKGAVSNFGAKTIVEQTITIEDIGKTGDLAIAEEAALTLRTLMDRFVPQLEACREDSMQSVTWVLPQRTAKNLPALGAGATRLALKKLEDRPA